MLAGLYVRVLLPVPRLNAEADLSLVAGEDGGESSRQVLW